MVPGLLGLCLMTMLTGFVWVIMCTFHREDKKAVLPISTETIARFPSMTVGM